ncbi:MAG: HAD family hydrolase [Collinsella sp.]
MIVFSDMDGTLLTSDKQMSDATWAMLDELARRRIEFVPCTGRPLSGIFEPILAHPAVHYAVCANGASVWQLDDGTPPMPHAPRHLEPTARPRHRPPHPSHRRRPRCDLRYLRGRAVLPPRSLYERLDEFWRRPHRGFAQAHTNTDRHGYRQQDRRGRDARTHRHVLARPADRDAIAAALGTLDGIEVTRSYEMNIEVMGEGATKGTALTWLCEHLGEPLADAWVFGDNINDIPMLQAAGHGMAMINGEPEDREAAGAITEFDNDHDGVARTIMAALA